MAFPSHLPCPSYSAAFSSLVLPIGQSLISVCMGHSKVDPPLISPNTKDRFSCGSHSGHSLIRAVSHFTSRNYFPGPAKCHRRKGGGV